MAYDPNEIQQAFELAATTAPTNDNILFARGRKNWASVDGDTTERVATLIYDHLRGKTHPSYQSFFPSVIDQTDKKSLRPAYTPDPFRFNLPEDNVLIEGASYRVLGALLHLRDKKNNDERILAENQELLKRIEHLEDTIHSLRIDVKTLLIMFKGKQAEVDRLVDQLDAVQVLLTSQKRTDRLDKNAIASIANTVGLILNTAVMLFSLNTSPPTTVVNVEQAAQSVIVYCDLDMNADIADRS